MNCEIPILKNNSLTVSTRRTLKSKKLVFSCNSWFLRSRASLGPWIVPSGPCTENLNTVLNTQKHLDIQGLQLNTVCCNKNACEPKFPEVC